MSDAPGIAAPPPEHSDVAIVGYGPVGQTAAILLGRAGHDVTVLERWPTLYPRPRAVHYDDEVARIFQRLGVAEELAAISEPAGAYEWQNAKGERLLLIDRTQPGPSGWPGATMFAQPALESVLDRAAKAVPSVSVHQGWEVTDAVEEGEQVRLRARQRQAEGNGDERELTASYAIGADGANSLLRERMGTAVKDLGFSYEWLIADTIPNDPSLLAGVNLQICDPLRPTTLVSGGPGRRRWEWMLLPGESREDVENEEFVWRMLAKSGVGPGDVQLERFTVYTFTARWAERWREGRMLLAGDAAHQMPPFAGQGMCSGIRDAMTLSWHLDLVLGGQAPASTLDAYTSERSGHLQHAIAISTELGKVICIAEEAEAAARDEVLLSVAADPAAPPIEPPAPVLGPGVLDAESPAAGSLFPQGRATVDGREQLVEDTIDGPFALYALDAEPSELLDGEALSFLAEIGCACVAVGPAYERLYREWFEAHDCRMALVRPDFYVFGTAPEATSVCAGALVARLRSALNQPSPEPATTTERG